MALLICIIWMDPTPRHPLRNCVDVSLSFYIVYVSCQCARIHSNNIAGLFFRL